MKGEKTEGRWKRDDVKRQRQEKIEMLKRRSEKLKKLLSIIFFALMVFMLHASRFTLHAAEPSPFDAIKKTYSEINSLTAQFHQKILISSLKKERAFDGSFLYKRQKGFLWQYQSPKGKYFLYDGKFIWQGEDEKPFVQKDRVNKEKTGGTFLDLVEDISKLDELFTLKSQGRAGDMDVLELLPKKDNTVKLAKAWIDRQNMVKKIEVHEFTGNINTIEFISIKVNQPVEDGRFVFRPDKNKEIVER